MMCLRVYIRCRVNIKSTKHNDTQRWREVARVGSIGFLSKVGHLGMKQETTGEGWMLLIDSLSSVARQWDGRVSYKKEVDKDVHDMTVTKVKTIARFRRLNSGLNNGGEILCSFGSLQYRILWPTRQGTCH